MVRLDNAGTVQWQQNFREGGVRYDLVDAAATADGGYILGGTSAVDGELADFWLVKIDSLGAFQWQRAIRHERGGFAADHELRAIRQADDGGYWLVGAVDPFSTWLVIRLDAAGALLWQYRYRNPDFPEGYQWNAPDGAVLTAGGGLIIAGVVVQTPRSNNEAIGLMRLAPDGQPLWYTTAARVVDPDPDNAKFLASFGVTAANDGDLLVAASYEEPTPGIGWLLKLDTTNPIFPTCAHKFDEPGVERLEAKQISDWTTQAVAAPTNIGINIVVVDAESLTLVASELICSD